MFGKNPHRFLYLLISLLLTILVFPVIEELERGRWLFGLFSSAILLSAVYAVSERKGYVTLALFLVVPALALGWTANFLDSASLHLAGNVVMVLLLCLVAALILSDVLRTERVSREKIFGALSVYLLIGFIWAILFFMVDFLVPGSFRMAQEGTQTSARMIYFSFVTLTTLGYGDIIPLSAAARGLANVEALLGQLYLTVLVARLVGLYITHSQQEGR
jgi:voltage-gated potassium channel Kch